MRRSPDDRGSVLLLGMGLVVLCALLVAALADIAVLRLARQDLLAQADAAAIAGAHAIDLDHLIDHGTLGASPHPVVPLDPRAAREAVADHLAAVSLPASVVRWRASRVDADSESVEVVLTAQVRLPFTTLVTGLVGGAGDVGVTAGARAQTRVG